MGKIADDLIESGQNTWFTHVHRNCDADCPYCYVEDEDQEFLDIDIGEKCE